MKRELKVGKPALSVSSRASCTNTPYEEGTEREDDQELNEWLLGLHQHSL